MSLAALAKRDAAKPKNGMDLMVHHRDTSGAVVDVTPYRLKIVGGIRYFEMPAGSKNIRYENNDVVPEKVLAQENIVFGKLPENYYTSLREVKISEENEKLRQQLKFQAVEQVEERSELDELRSKVETLQATVENQAKTQLAKPVVKSVVAPQPTLSAKDPKP